MGLPKARPEGAFTSPLRGEVKSRPRLLRRLLARPLEFALALVLAVTPLGGAFANPLNGQVAAGQATIAGQGTKTVTINQQSQSAIINWNTFNIATGELTHFIQPNSSAIALNRVTGGLGPSQIYGTITANGRIFLVNPDGILFGLGARVDAAGFLASTNDIKNSDFMAGHYVFNIPGRLDASIVNLGRITATSGGFAALVAPGVRNAGVISARLGNVALASGNGFTLDFYGDKLITLQVDNGVAGQVIDVATGQPLDALVKNEGKLRANGGIVSLTAAAARHVVDAVINNTGVIEANSVGTRNGMIVLGAATATKKPQDAPTQNVVVSGTLSAAGTKAGQKGGTVVITGEQIALQGAKINASGTAGGGTVLIGGDTGGGHLSAAVASIPQAQLQHWPVAIASMVAMDQASVINASATQKGDGGKVVVWSNGLTSVAGLIAASGGPFGGNGGFVETSGHTVDFAGIRVDTSAPNGHAGLWLVDPYNLIVDAAAAATIASNLATTSVTLQTTAEGTSGPGNTVSGAGDIIINSGIAWSSSNTLTLSAYNGITVNAPITIQGAGGLDMSAANTPGLTAVPLISFGTGGSVQFTGTPNTGQTLVINKQSYTLLYNMSDVQGINASSESLSGYYALAKPIDASGVTGWVPIGTDGNGQFQEGSHGFIGIFQGLGNTISNLTVFLPNTDSVGLFGYVGSQGVVANVGLVGGSITGSTDVGALSANNLGIVVNSYSSASVSGVANVGGLIGANGNFVIQSHATGSVSGNMVGGLIGSNGDGGQVINSYASGMVVGTGQSSVAGGLVGDNLDSIVQSYATGPVTGSAIVGGLVGINEPGSISQSYATGAVQLLAVGQIFDSQNTQNVGGLVGLNSGIGAIISQSYATGSVVGATDFSKTGGLVGANIFGAVIQQAYATGAVQGSGSQSVVGGLVGWNSSNASITQSYATGGVLGGTGSVFVGGLVGENTATISQSYSSGAVTGGDSASIGGLVGFNNGSITTSYWDVGTSGVGIQNGVGNQIDAPGVGGLTTAQFGNPSNFSGWSFGATPGGPGWVIVDNDGSLNNASGAGATRPMLLSEYSTTITNAHQLQLIVLDPAASYTLANNIDLGPALANRSEVWGPNGSAGFVPIGGNSGSGVTILVGQCLAFQACYYGPYTPWSSTLNAAQLYSLGGQALLEADQTSPYVIRLGATTLTFATPSGSLVEQLPEFSGGYHVGPCSVCENDTVGTFSIPGNATSATIAGTFGNSVVYNSSGVNVLLVSSAPAGFTGTFNGNGHIIANLTISQPSANNAGLFGHLGVGGTVENVGLVGANVTGGNSVGALIGLSDGAVTNSYATGMVNGASNVGGLVGWNNGTISQSHASTAVNGTNAATAVSLTSLVDLDGSANIGGLVGFNSSGGTISNSFATGAVTTANVAVGGLVGWNDGAVSGSYAAGTVTGNGAVGGLVGVNPGSINGSYATGSVSGTNEAGGLAANNGGTITQSYASGAVAGTIYVGGLVGAGPGQISQSYASGNVTGTTAVGGLVGQFSVITVGGTIDHSYATGNVIGTTEVGGLVGNNGGTITQSYATGPVSGSTSVGGLVGNNVASGSVASSYWDTQTSGQYQGVGTNAGSFSATGLTTTQFGNAANFADWKFGTKPGGAGCGDGGGCWVIVDVNGSLNNAGEAAGATRPMLLSEWSSNIANGHQLQLIALNPSASYTLANNIDLAPALANASDVWGPNRSAGFVPIGQTGVGFTGNPFSGTFDGQGNTISGLTIAPTDPGVNNIGLFGVNAGTIQNLNLTNVAITANRSFSAVGTLAGQNFGLIDNVTASGTINGGASTGVNAGGLVGQNNWAFVFNDDGPPLAVPGVVQNSFANVAVTLGNGVFCSGSTCNGGWNNAGGLVGYNSADISGSSASGAIVVGSNSFAGGLVGANQRLEGTLQPLSGPSIVSSSATGNVSSDGVNVALGGLVGYNAPLAVISNAQAGGNVTASASTVNGSNCSATNSCQAVNVGGLVGQNQGTISGNKSAPSASTLCGDGQTCAIGLVTVGSGGAAGGFAGFNDGIILNVFATGDVSGAAGSSNNSTSLGGLVGQNQGAITGSLASGTIGAHGVGFLQAGGFVAENNGTIISSVALGDVLTGDSSLAGGFAANNKNPDNNCSGCIHGDGYNTNATIYASNAQGAVSGGGNSILAGFVAALDIGGTISNAQASGAVASSGPNSIVAGFVGVNGGTISQSQAAGTASAGTNSYLGGFSGINFGSIQDSTTAGNVAVLTGGSGDVVGGFAAVNFGLIDPSYSSSTITGGSSNIVGDFAGGNINVPNAPPGFPLPGQITDSSYIGPSSYPNIPTTSITSAYPQLPSLIGSCTGSGLCQLLQFTFLTPSTPPSTSSGPTVDTPPPIQQVVVPLNNNNNNTPPILVNLTTGGTHTGNNANGNSNGNNGNHNNNAGPPQSPGPPPGPGLGRTYDEQHFSGVPPIGETRFLPSEIVVQISNTVPLASVLKIAQGLGIALVSSQSVDLTGRVVYRFRVTNGKDIRILIRALEKNNVIASAQPNYVFIAGQSAPAAPAAAAAAAPPAPPAPVEHTDSIPPKTEPPSEPGLANANTASLESLPAGDAAQYVIDKMHLVQIHNVARGRNVVVAVVDSEIDVNHPDLKGDILERYDATGTPSHPHPHGTGMAGAIAAHYRLLGIAPGVKILAIKAFDEQASNAEATSFQIIKGLDFAIAHKARIINMSFAGPHDPMMARTLKLAHDKGIILVAAAGNAGPKSPPLYPGADPNVIAVTASDYNDRPFSMANRGKYIAVGAPGVDVMVPAPGNTYQLTTGTSVATAHVSGVAALLVERKPDITPDEVRAILMRTATPYSARPKGEEDGAGLVDPVAALRALGPDRAAQIVPHASNAVH